MDIELDDVGMVERDDVSSNDDIGLYESNSSDYTNITLTWIILLMRISVTLVLRMDIQCSVIRYIPII